MGRKNLEDVWPRTVGLPGVELGQNLVIVAVDAV